MSTQASINRLDRLASFIAQGDAKVIGNTLANRLAALAHSSPDPQRGEAHSGERHE